MLQKIHKQPSYAWGIGCYVVIMAQQGLRTKAHSIATPASSMIQSNSSI